ncbi:MAG TPA: glycosyltransferase family 2 protein [Patescibacteria group bacterium]|nr:glycosyltransferase family 2 protein [Patescibacteria group bacterium]
MAPKISVVINTFNEEANIERAIKSVAWAEEILVCDMYSDDDTAVIAKKLGAKIIFHKRAGFVEPARNLAISKAEGDWILILDADEEISPELADKIKEITSRDGVVAHVEIPRKNIIFGKALRASMWWPDYNTRLFKKNSVIWGNKIHSKPKTEGQGLTLTASESNAIVHYHYQTVSQYLQRMDRYTTIQAKELKESGYVFDWRDLISKPLGEFLSRFYANRGFEDGLHGLALSLLQSFSHFVMYLKTWERKDFADQNLKFEELNQILKESGTEINYWMNYGNLSSNKIKRVFQKLKNKLI